MSPCSLKGHIIFAILKTEIAMKFFQKQRIQIFIPLALFFLSSGTLFGQSNATPLLLDDALQASLKHNKQIVIAQTEEAIAKSQYTQTEAIWLPQVNLSHTAYSTNDPLNAFGFKLQQAGVQQTDFNPSLLNNPSDYSNYSTAVDVKQPILNIDMLYLRKAAKQQIQVFENKSKRTTEAIQMQVIQTYLQLEFAYKVQEVTKDALRTMESIYKFTNDRFRQGMLQKSDLLNVEVQVKSAEVQLSQANSQIQNISDQLSLLMNTPKGKVYSILPYTLAPERINNDSVAMGRSDIRAMTAALHSFDLAIKATQMGWMPKLNAFGNYHINDKTISLGGAKSYIAGVQLSWDLFKGNQIKNKIATQKLEKLKVQEQLSSHLENGAIEIRKTKRNIEDAGFKLLQQKKAVEQSEEALRIIKNRYEQGLVSTNDLLISQTQLSQQKLYHAQAQFEYQTAINYLAFLTSK